MAAWQLNSTPVITCCDLFILFVQFILRLCQFEIKIHENIFFFSTNSYNVYEHAFIHNTSGVGLKVTPSQSILSKPKRKHSVDSINSPTVPGEQKSPETIEMPLATRRTLNALREAGLLPLEDYTSVVLDTKTFGPRPKSRTQETSVDERTTNGRYRGPKGPYTIPGQPRPVWSMEDEPDLENNIEEISRVKVHGSRTSLRYSDDDVDDSGRSDDSGITGGQRRKRKTQFLRIDNVEHSSNA